MPPVTLSVVIPAYNEADQIVGAIESARAPGVEVLVVDGGSADGTRNRAEAAGARVVALEGAPGRARQLAAGAAQTHGDVILFLHADTRLPSGYAAAVESSLVDPAVVGGSFRFAFDARGAALRFVEWGARLRVALFAMPYGDQGLFVRREVLTDMGGVPQAPIMEDMDLVAAMKQRGKLANLTLPATTSARRYLQGGVLRTMLRNWLAASAWVLGVDRARVAAWYRQ